MESDHACFGKEPLELDIARGWTDHIHVFGSEHVSVKELRKVPQFGSKTSKSGAR
jgi:hypothetical protein